MSVYLTSFKRCEATRHSPLVPTYSAAVYQPKGFHFPKLGFFDIRTDGGLWVRPRLFLAWEKPLEGYRDALLSLYDARRDKIQAWVDSLPSTVNLCCWCPYEQAAQRQIAEFGSFVCHTEVIRIFLTKLGVSVTLDTDRQERMKRLDVD